MSPEHQTIAALIIVGLTVGVMVYAKFFRKRSNPGCGCGDACTAITPEIKKLQAQASKR